MRTFSFVSSAALIVLAHTASSSVVEVSSNAPNATVELVPRQSGISALDCTLQLSLVQCCQTFEPLSAVASIVGPILNELGIPLPGLGTLVAFDCQDTVLGLGCTDTAMCCTVVVPNQNIGLNCVPVTSPL